MFIKFENLPVYGFLSHRFQGCRSFLIALQSKSFFTGFWSFDGPVFPHLHTVFDLESLSFCIYSGVCYILKVSSVPLSAWLIG